jgi:Chromo (CHRromatin Organisation MOdifier) domain
MLYEVIQCIRRDLYKLKLLASIESIHLVFYTSLLRLDSNDLLQGQHVASQPPILVQDEELDEEDAYKEWEVEEVVDSRYSYSFLEYKVKWKGHPMERRKWYRAHLFTNAAKVLNDFHTKYPNKPAPRQDGLRVRQADLDSRVQERNSALEKNLTLRRDARLALE